jgi:hypothetical protein
LAYFCSRVRIIDPSVSLNCIIFIPPFTVTVPRLSDRVIGLMAMLYLWLPI